MVAVTQPEGRRREAYYAMQAGDASRYRENGGQGDGRSTVMAAPDRDALSALINLPMVAKLTQRAVLRWLATVASDLRGLSRRFPDHSGI